MISVKLITIKEEIWSCVGATSKANLESWLIDQCLLSSSPKCRYKRESEMERKIVFLLATVEGCQFV